MLEQEIESLKSLKNEINGFNIQENDQDFVKLVTLKNVDPELRENLILLHSNYKTELKDLKSFMYQSMYKLIDKTESIVLS